MMREPSTEADAGAAEGSAPFGQFRWDTRTDRWQWSPGMYRLHGYRPGVIAPSVGLVLQHKDEAHRGRATRMFDQASSTAFSYINHHRIVDALGRIRTVLTVGQSTLNRSRADRGSAQQDSGQGAKSFVSTGFMADLTELERLAGTAAVQAASANRSVINQARGALMAVYGLDAEAAMAMLIWYSRNHNRKLAALCLHLTAGMRDHGPVTTHAQLTALLLTAAEAPVRDAKPSSSRPPRGRARD